MLPLGTRLRNSPYRENLPGGVLCCHRLHRVSRVILYCFMSLLFVFTPSPRNFASFSVYLRSFGSFSIMSRVSEIYFHYFWRFVSITFPPIFSSLFFVCFRFFRHFLLVCVFFLLLVRVSINSFPIYFFRGMFSEYCFFTGSFRHIFPRFLLFSGPFGLVLVRFLCYEYKYFVRSIRAGFCFCPYHMICS